MYEVLLFVPTRFASLIAALSLASNSATTPTSRGSAKPRSKAKYALSRKLYFYTVGSPKGETQKFLKWATSSRAAGKIVSRVGFIPVN